MTRPSRPAGRRPPRRRSASARAGASRRPPAAAARRRSPRTRPRPRRDRLYLVGIAALVILVGVMALGPYADYTAAQDRVDTLIAERTALDEAVQDLESEAERLQDPAALEEQARADLGMARPGEVPYIVVNPPTEDPAPVNANPTVPTEEPSSVVDRVVDWVLAWAR